MDEVDGVGQGDRGGLGALLLIIKKTRVPIILICNDRGDRRIQSLLNQSYDIKFTQATSRQIFERIKLIADKEGFEVD
jgi:replication factor C subunit 1